MCVLYLAQPLNQPRPPTLTCTAAYQPVAPVTTIWSAALDKLDKLAELDDQKRLFTDAVGTELLLNPFVGGELAQALGDLPAVFDRKEP